MDIFSKLCAQNGIKVADNNLRKLITSFVGKEKENPINLFCTLLESIGIVTPVTLGCLNQRDESFNCITGNGKTLLMATRDGTTDDFDQLIIIEGEVSYYYDYLPFDSEERLELSSTTITKNDRKLHNYYYKFFCHRTLTLQNCYCVKVNVSEPEHRNADKIRVLEHRQSIENYLLDLTFPCYAQNIYNKVMELYDFDDSIISTISSIDVSVEKILTKDRYGRADKTLPFSVFSMKDGKIQHNSFGICRDGECYSIFSSGDWVYSNEYADCKFSATTNLLTATINVNETTISYINNTNIIKTAFEKINSIRGEIN